MPRLLGTPIVELGLGTPIAEVKDTHRRTRDLGTPIESLFGDTHRREDCDTRRGTRDLGRDLETPIVSGGIGGHPSPGSGDTHESFWGHESLWEHPSRGKGFGTRVLGTPISGAFGDLARFRDGHIQRTAMPDHALGTPGSAYRSASSTIRASITLLPAEPSGANKIGITSVPDVPGTWSARIDP